MVLGQKTWYFVYKWHIEVFQWMNIETTVTACHLGCLPVGRDHSGSCMEQRSNTANRPTFPYAQEGRKQSRRAGLLVSLATLYGAHCYCLVNGQSVRTGFIHHSHYARLLLNYYSLYFQWFVCELVCFFFIFTSPLFFSDRIAREGVDDRFIRGMS